MNARLKNYPLDRITADQLMRIAYLLFRSTGGLKAPAESALAFASHRTDCGASEFLG
jgi:hypothetical protein